MVKESITAKKEELEKERTNIDATIEAGKKALDEKREQVRAYGKTELGMSEKELADKGVGGSTSAEGKFDSLNSEAIDNLIKQKEGEKKSIEAQMSAKLTEINEVKDKMQDLHGSPESIVEGTFASSEKEEDIFEPIPAKAEQPQAPEALPEKSATEKAIDDTRAKFIEEYQKSHKNIKNELLIAKTKAALSNIFKSKDKKQNPKEEDFYGVELKKADKEYREARMAHAQALIDTKKAELAKLNLDPKELEKQLNAYQAGEVLDMTVIAERQKLLDAKAEFSVVRKSGLQKAWAWYQRQPRPVRIALATTLFSSGALLGGTLGAGAFAGSLAYRIGKSYVIGAVSKLATKSIDVLNATNDRKLEEGDQAVLARARQQFAEGKLTMKQFEDQVLAIDKEKHARARNRALAKAAVGVTLGFGAGYGLSHVNPGTDMFGHHEKVHIQNPPRPVVQPVEQPPAPVIPPEHHHTPVHHTPEKDIVPVQKDIETKTPDTYSIPPQKDIDGTILGGGTVASTQIGQDHIQNISPTNGVWHNDNIKPITTTAGGDIDQNSHFKIATEEDPLKSHVVPPPQENTVTTDDQTVMDNMPGANHDPRFSTINDHTQTLQENSTGTVEAQNINPDDADSPSIDEVVERHYDRTITLDHNGGQIEQTDTMHFGNTHEVRQALGRDNVVIERVDTHSIEGMSYRTYNQAEDYMFHDKGVHFESIPQYRSEHMLQQLFGHANALKHEAGVPDGIYPDGAPNSGTTVSMFYFREDPTWPTVQKIPAKYFFNFHDASIGDQGLPTADVDMLTKAGILNEQHEFVKQSELMRLAKTYAKVDPEHAKPLGNETIEHYVRRITRDVHQADDGTFFMVKPGALQEVADREGMPTTPGRVINPSAIRTSGYPVEGPNRIISPIRGDYGYNYYNRWSGTARRGVGLIINAAIGRNVNIGLRL